MEYRIETFELKYRPRGLRARYQESRRRRMLERNPEIAAAVAEMQKEVERQLFFWPDDG